MSNFNKLHPILCDVKPKQALCITGHRPKSLPKGEKLLGLSDTLRYYLEYAVAIGYRYFFDGLADGADYLAIEHLTAMRADFPDIRIIGVQPCTDYETFFHKRHYDIEHLQRMKCCVDALIQMPDSSKNPDVFLSRNRFMVDYSSAIIAVCSHRKSGSMYTLHYAQRKKLAYCRIEANPNLLYQPSPKNWPIEQKNFLQE